MVSERRGTLRIAGPFDATWSGTSGNRQVRIADLSVAGCFVDALAAPAAGEHVTLTLHLPGGSPFEVTGHVLYVYQGQGFAVGFDTDERAASQLHVALQRLAQR